MTSDYYIPRWEERTSYNTRRVDPYTKLSEDRTIFLGIPISDDIVNTVMVQLLRLQSMSAERQISIYINFPDGSSTAPAAIYDTMRYVELDIQTVCPGQATSVAALLLAVGTKGKRLALPNSHILIYQPATEGGYEQNSDLEIQAKEVMCICELMENVLAADTGQAVTGVSRDIKHDKYLIAQEAIEYGIADDVLTLLKDIGT